MKDLSKRCKSGILSLFFTFCFAILNAQQGAVLPDRDNSLITKQLFNVLMAHREVEYFGLPLYFNSNQYGRNTDSLPTRRYLPYFEANLAPYYIVLKGRDLQRDWLKRFSIAFEPQMTFRIYLSKAQSFPVRPPSFQPKFHFNYFIHPRLDSATTRFQHLSLIIGHLSNGQPNPFFLDSAKTIVNLRNGNFSTNYLRFGYTFSQYINPKTDANDRDGWKSNAFWSATLAYQREINIGNLLTFDKDMNILGYGKNRLVSRLQFRSGNFLGMRAIFSSYDQPPVYQSVAAPIVERDTTVIRDGQSETLYYIRPYVIVQKLEAQSRKHPKGYWNWMARVDQAIVLDRKAINRYNADLIFELRNLNWRSFSIIAKCSWGRDYMNLRFGERIQSYQIGISYNMDRYKVPYTTYIETLEKGDVIKLNDARDRELSLHKTKLPEIDMVTPSVAPVQSYVLYDRQLDMRAQTPASLDQKSELFRTPPLYRFVNGAWQVVSNDAAGLKRIQKEGWYRAADLSYDKILNGSQ